MDNNYFESLANAIQDSEPKSDKPKESPEATLTVKVDINCKLYCDGDFLDLFEANKVKKISIPTGQHLITIESEQFDEITEDQVIDAKELGKNYLLLIKDLKEKEDVFKKNKESKIAQAAAEKEEKEKEKEKKKKEKEQEELKKAQLVQEMQDNLQKGKEYYEAHIYDLAISCFEKAVVATNDAEALLYIGLCYEGQDGDDESIRDYEKAITWYRKAAEKGNARAQNIMGNRYFNGKCVEQNYVEAVKWYRKSAMQGYDAAQRNLGICYGQGKGVGLDYAKAFEWYTKAAEQGYAIAQSDLGWCYRFGKGVKTDNVKAVEWYTKAAKQGDAYSQCELGYCYSNGLGVSLDYAIAFEWYTKAAEQGNVIAQSNLGWCYENGKGVETDHAKAIEWYTKAAARGNAYAQCELGSYYEGQGKDFAKAEEWYLKAANQGYLEGQYRLGLFYFLNSGLQTGKVVMKNANNAIKWLTEAANQGYADAMHNLGYLYHTIYLIDGIEDIGVFDACSLSVEWYKKYLETTKEWPVSLEDRIVDLAECYSNGNGVEKNTAKAIECLKSGLKLSEAFDVKPYVLGSMQMALRKARQKQ